MYPPSYRAVAKAWLTFFELSLLPLRLVAESAPAAEPEPRDVQAEVWREMLAQGCGSPIDRPIFTDEVLARADAL